MLSTAHVFSVGAVLLLARSGCVYLRVLVSEADRGVRVVKKNDW